MTEQSRSVQRRIAAQKGQPAPDFSEPKYPTEEELIQKIIDSVYIDCESSQPNIISLRQRIKDLINQPEVTDMLARKAGLYSTGPRVGE